MTRKEHLQKAAHAISQAEKFVSQPDVADGWFKAAEMHLRLAEQLQTPRDRFYGSRAS